jgi:putative phage-type endonuclease
MTAYEEKLRAERLTGMGATDAAAALGVSQWRTPLDVYLEKCGEAPPKEETEPMRWGKKLEAPILERFAERHGSTGLILKPLMQRHPVFTWMIAHLDAKMPGTAVVEAKTSRTAEGWGEDGSSEAPADYVVQVHHQMIVDNASLAYIPVLIGGSDYREIQIPFDKELGKMIIDATANLWLRIAQKLPPEPRTLADVNTLYRRASDGAIAYASDKVALACNLLANSKRAQVDLTAEIEELERQIKAEIGAADTLEYQGKVLATWKNTQAQRFDSAAFKHDAPDLYAQYSKETSYRRFLLKKEKA